MLATRLPCPGLCPRAPCDPVCLQASPRRLDDTFDLILRSSQRFLISSRPRQGCPVLADTFPFPVGSKHGQEGCLRRSAYHRGHLFPTHHTSSITSFSFSPISQLRPGHPTSQYQYLPCPPHTRGSTTQPSRESTYLPRHHVAMLARPRFSHCPRPLTCTSFSIVRQELHEPYPSLGCRATCSTVPPLSIRIGSWALDRPALPRYYLPESHCLLPQRRRRRLLVFGCVSFPTGTHPIFWNRPVDRAARHITKSTWRRLPLQQSVSACRHSLSGVDDSAGHISISFKAGPAVQGGATCGPKG